MIIFFILLSITFLTVKTAAPLPTCPSNMIQSHKDPNVCYWFVANVTSFDDAENVCIKNGGHLAPVFDQFANFFLSENAFDAFKNADDFWIGGKSFNIVDGVTIWLWTWHNSYPIYTDWNPGQGKPSKNSCVASNINTALWSSVNCGLLKPFVCQISAVTDVCDPEWSYFKAPNQDGMCYKYMAQANITSLQAQNICLSQNANLVSIHGPEENSFLAKMGQDKIAEQPENEGVFIGLEYQNSTWNWLDGSNLNYENWGPERPNFVNAFSVFMYPDYPATGGPGWSQKWDNWGFPTLLNRFVCKKKPNWVFLSEKML